MLIVLYAGGVVLKALFYVMDQVVSVQMRIASIVMSS